METQLPLQRKHGHMACGGINTWSAAGETKTALLPGLGCVRKSLRLPSRIRVGGFPVRPQALSLTLQICSLVLPAPCCMPQRLLPHSPASSPLCRDTMILPGFGCTGGVEGQKERGGPEDLPKEPGMHFLPSSLASSALPAHMKQMISCSQQPTKRMKGFNFICWVSVWSRLRPISFPVFVFFPFP